jgi:hypothetical protein
MNHPLSTPPAVAVITCAVLDAEIRHLASSLPCVRHIETLEQGLHNEPPRLRREVQAAIERIENTCAVDAIALGYGLCSRGTEGLTAGRCALVMARAHDCITLLLGCRRRYASYVAEHPGTYWYSHGWNRHHLPPGQQRYEKLYQQYLERFGEDDAKYLMEVEQAWFRSYSRATYVDLGVGTTGEDLQYTQQCARWLGWAYDYQRGDAGLLRTLLSGPWDRERFVVLRPGETFQMTADDRVIEATVKGRRAARPADATPPEPAGAAP